MSTAKHIILYLAVSRDVHDLVQHPNDRSPRGRISTSYTEIRLVTGRRQYQLV